MRIGNLMISFVGRMKVMFVFYVLFENVVFWSCARNVPIPQHYLFAQAAFRLIDLSHAHLAGMYT
jgi:hypothetical protein